MKKIINKQNKFTVIGALFIVVTFSIAIIVLSHSYALEGFGQLNLSCDKTNGLGGEEISCIITGTVDSASQVSSLSSQIKLSENLEFVSFTTNSIWEGVGDDGNIQLYTDENKSSTFDIGTFTIRIKEGVTNTTESITLEDNYLYDEKFEEHEVIDTTVEIRTPQYNSDVYEFGDGYILTDTKDIATILENINTEGCSVIVKVNSNEVSTDTIKAGYKLAVVNNDVTIDEFDIVYIGSDVYDLSKEYIIDNSETLNNITNNVEVINGSLSIKNGQLVLSYNNTSIKSYDIINIYSEFYYIDVLKKYIVVDTNEISLDDMVISDNITLSINNSNLDIIYNEKVVESLKIINITSDKYGINLKDKYINIFSDSINDSLNNIKTNASIVIDDNKLKIVDGEVGIVSLDVLGISSSKYSMSNLDSQTNYIYTGSDSNLDIIKKNVTLLNKQSVLSLVDGFLQLSYKDNLVFKFKLYYLGSSEYLVSDNIIYIKGSTDYNTFISNLEFNNMNYEIYDANNSKITSGNIDEGYSIKLYIGDKLIDTYTVKTEYLDIKNIDVKKESKIIYNITLGTTYNELIKNIDTSGTISVLDKNGKEVDLGSNVKSYDEIVIKLSSSEEKYKMSVFGDVTGSGSVTAGDIAKMYQSVKGKITLDEVALLASDVTVNGKVEVNDVAKSYSYLKGKLQSLK